MIFSGRRSSPLSVNGASIGNGAVGALSVLKKFLIHTHHPCYSLNTISNSLHENHRASDIINAVAVLDTWLIKIAMLKDSAFIADRE
jgi:hypothetical protein